MSATRLLSSSVSAELSFSELSGVKWYELASTNLFMWSNCDLLNQCLFVEVSFKPFSKELGLSGLVLAVLLPSFSLRTFVILQHVCFGFDSNLELYTFSQLIGSNFFLQPVDGCLSVRIW